MGTIKKIKLIVTDFISNVHEWKLETDRDSKNVFCTSLRGKNK